MVDGDGGDAGEPDLKRSRSNGDASPVDGQQANSSSPPNGTGQSAARLYSCGKCSKSYARLDHLSRHVRTSNEPLGACQTSC